MSCRQQCVSEEEREWITCRQHRRPRSSQAMVSLVLVGFLVFAVVPWSAALEIDSDLVFDDNTNNVNTNNDITEQHHKTSQHHKRSNVTFVLLHKKSDHTVVAPVASPIDAQPRATSATLPPHGGEEEDSLFWRIHSFSRRVKRDLYDWWDGSTVTSQGGDASDDAERVKRSVDGHKRKNKKYHRLQEEEDEEDDDLFDAADEEFNDLPPKEKKSARLLVRSRGDTATDDEDDYVNPGDPSGSGQGLPGQGETEVSPQYFRVSCLIHEPHQTDFDNRNSFIFKQISRNLSAAIIDLYRDLPGKRDFTLVSIKEVPNNMFFSKATFDVGSYNYDNAVELKDRLQRQIETHRRLGSVEVSPEDFTFRQFQRHPDKPTLPESTCEDNQMQCRSGECVSQDARCNGKEECVDGSDELGCPLTPPTSAPATELPGAVVTPEDRCRADDKVRCADGSAYICDAQLCDGRPDCPGGTDEHNCQNDCAEGELMCDLSRCVPLSKRCDKHQDCADGTDEQDCPLACESDQWQCDFGSCIDKRKRCDGKQDCPRDDSDERNCRGLAPQLSACARNQFTCRSDNSCIPLFRKCDKISDCPDKSDEQTCPCKVGEFECANKHCIDMSRRCDGTTNCNDGSDELNCHSGCAANEFQCRDDRTCIPSALKCNRQSDCNDHSDEENCDGASACRSDQFRCDDGLCLNINQRCNTVQECIHGEDEKGCDAGKNCGPGEFHCSDGPCISDAFRCDKIPDCVDRSDESNCPNNDSHVPLPPPCGPNDVVCGDGKCVAASKRCDHIFDCVDAADERDCDTCNPSEFRCEDGKCISADQRCDNRRDCRDGSDELDCVDCPADQFKCADGTCIDSRYRCNRRFECLDRSDEDNCNNGVCEAKEFRCGDGTCINESYKCDTFTDCLDGSDEVGCPRVTCSSHQFTCGDGRCIDGRFKCDGTADCQDASDETDCGCQPNEFMCVSGECVPSTARCNRRIDCLDGSDETNCPAPTPQPPPTFTCPGQFACRTGRQCMPLSAVCNGSIECQDFSDEHNCALSCPRGEFRCENGPCIPSYQRCNGRVDCPLDTSDELDCQAAPGGLNLKTYPEDQIIKESREVVFQCRDEGPLRARVHWVRGNNLPLPTGSYDNNGRLEMPNIQVEHSGTYLCQAVGYPRTAPGASVAVTLSVEPYAPPPTRPPKACGILEATCANGECINKQLVCDGKFDCSDGSDEYRCSPQGCEPNQFRCANSKCVLKTWRCDSENDCGDNSDEVDCALTQPGSQCKYNEYQCRSGNQCIPRSFHCDLEIDCLDGSDEVGCSAVHVQVPPPPMVQLEVGQVFTITCTAIGVPTPEVSWRLNWGHIPPKCTTTSVNGFGTLTCPDIQEADQGAYSCEAINNRGSKIGVPDTILVIATEKTPCNQGFFNAEARSKDECISCFCFGVTTECKSADLFTYQLPPPFDQYKLIGVHIPQPDGAVSVGSDFTFGGQAPHLRPISRQGFQVNARSNERMDNDIVPYFAMPENYHGNQLKSYGGYLKYTVRYEGSGRPIQAPDIILMGNGYTLVHTQRVPLTASQDNDVAIRFFYGEWYKRSEARPGGDISGETHNRLATREDIMMALGGVDNILIKSQYISGASLDTSITDIHMDSAGARNTGQGKASFVEECRCPAGYAGLSCENCASGFSRHPSGPWLGQCVPETLACPPGTYADPSRHNHCEPCPCPLTNPDNQFGRTCQLDYDGQVTCNCPAGYIGRRCELCAAGYQGNPLRPGDRCEPAGQCDVAGSLQTLPDPGTGSCPCKVNVVGSTCNQCQPNTFHLDVANQFGCISCFCMGVTQACSSSNWYRQQILASFVRNTQDFRLVEISNRDEPITEGIRLVPGAREISFQDFSRRSPDVYYWLLPNQFLGDKITSYGGVLNYTIRYVPAPGGQSSRNNAPDVELISSNDIKLLYFGRDQIEPNRPETISVPFLEQYWQRHDGQAANREHMLMALADVEAILIKATYTTNTREAALVHVSLDIAEERNTGQLRAMAVEQCSCPRGYKGLSCHDCDVGYTRAEEGLYLGLCEPCNCHGHSSECHPDTGVCLNCRDNTEGEQCDECAAGYEGDAKEGRPSDCQRRVGPGPQCDCSPSGAVGDQCRNGNQCECKRNVEGLRCDTCRPGCFDLSAENPDGCLECFCSGVTDICQSSNLYRTQIPMAIFDSNHGFTLTDNDRVDVIRHGMVLDESMNEIGFTFTDTRRMFWSLPPMFTGNKVTSYGGNLTVTQRYTTRDSPSHDQDVVIIGNGVTLFWTNPQLLEPNRQITYSVPLREHFWTHLDVSGPRPASRADLITALSNMEAILVRATHAVRTQSSYLSDVSLDTAVPQPTGQAQAREVEACRCLPEYRGTSCESCSSGHYRDYNDRSLSVFGACKRCPCNGNEESCNVSPDGRGVVCTCLPGYSGRYCDSTGVTEPARPTPLPAPTGRPTISITISEPTIQIVEIGTTVRYRCLGRSLITQKPVSLEWTKEGGFLPRDRAIDDHQGLLVITDVRVSDSGTYICSANDGRNIVTERAVLTVGGSPPISPRLSIQPRYATVTEGEPVEFRCEWSGNPAPNLRWMREENKQLSAESSFSNSVFRITSVRKSDEGKYECHGTNPSGTDVQQTVLYVREGPTAPAVQLSVTPQEYAGPGGEEVIRFTCLTGGHDRHYTVRWTKAGGREMPASAVQRDGVLTIYNAAPADSGLYVCTATSITTGAVEQAEARVTIVSFRGPPTARMEPDRQTVSQGTHAELRCMAAGEPTPIVRWSRVGEDLPRNSQVIGDLLRINNIQVNDRGVYVCIATNEGGTSQASAIVEVERREPPTLELYPESRQTVTAGGSALLQCRVTGGIPAPRVRWSRPDGRPLSGNVEDLEGGVLRFQRVTIAEAGQYMCHAENDAGQVTATATLEIQSIPTITLLPGRTVTTTIGQRVRLECRSTGEPQPSVAWSKYRPGHPTYDRSGAPDQRQSAVYEITRVSKEDEGAYICVARNSAGDTEDRLQLIVEEGHVVAVDPYDRYNEEDRDRYPTDRDRDEQHRPSDRGGHRPSDRDRDDEHRRPSDRDRDEQRRPSDRDRDGHRSEARPFPPVRPNEGVVLDQDVFRVPVGGRAEMRCHVKGNREQVFIDWVRPHSQPMPAGYLVQDGTLFISNVDSSAAGDYSCVGRSQQGSVLFTANARLEVIAPPHIQLNPTRQVVRPGDHAYITCSATGDQPITIEWIPTGRPFSPRVSAERGLLQFRGIEVSDAGRYICKATNSAGDAEAAAEVIVSEHQTQPTVTAVQREQSTPVGTSIQLRCNIPSEFRNPQVTWIRDGGHLPHGSVVAGPMLELSNVQSSDQGRYICNVRHSDGASSDYIDLRVEPVSAPRTVISIQPSQEVVRVGDTVDVRCLVSGAGNAQVSWSKTGGEGLEANAQAYGNLLRISEVRPTNGGVYRCSVKTLTGSFAEDYVLAIQGEDVLNTQSPPVETRTAPHGTTVMMDCRTDLEAPVQYSWSKHGGPLPTDAMIDEASLTLHDIRSSDAGTYVCTAQNSHVKMDIPTVLVVTGIVPYFAQAPESYMALPTLPDAYLTFSIEISFKPQGADGMILYNGQQRGGSGDFISLGLNNSYVEFRFNMGSGPALVRSDSPVTMGEWHTVKLHRTRKEAAMYVDGHGPMKGMALGRFQGLDLVEPLFIGGVPDFKDIHRLNGFNKGFVGCISRLLIGSVDHELVRDATITRGVTTCETCAVNPCKNQGVCQEANQPQGYVCICPSSFSGANCERVGLACYPGACGTGRCVNRPAEGYDCYCPFGRSGAKCQDEIGITEPAFADEAYLAYPTPKAVKRLKMALKVNPKTTEDGVLLYVSQSDDGLGDFASLAIRDKRLEFRFDTGSGPAILRSDRDLVPGQWVTVSAGRDLREGHLSVNNDAPITGRSPGDKRGLNLRTPLYVGGYDKHKVKLASGVGVSKGFEGCLSEIKVAGIEMDLFESLVDSANVQDCSTVSSNAGAACDYNPCANRGRCVSSAEGQYTCLCPLGYSGRNCEISSDICQSQQPCRNGGTCVGLTTSYNCRCPLGYSGDNCQNIADLNKDVSFMGDGYIEFRNSLLPHKDSSENEIIIIEFTTTESNGLIFWHGQEAQSDGRGLDFLALAVVDGYLEFSYELGSGPAQIRDSTTKVDDGRRHLVVLKRQGTDGSIEVDGGVIEFGESPGILNTLNTRGNIYIGGVENFDLMTAGRYAHSFTGCIHKIRFQQSDINIGANAVDGVNAQPCSSDGESDDSNNTLDGLGGIVH